MKNDLLSQGRGAGVGAGVGAGRCPICHGISSVHSVRSHRLQGLNRATTTVRYKYWRCSVCGHFHGGGGHRRWDGEVRGLVLGLLDAGVTAAAISREYGIPASTICGWKRR